MHGQQQDGTPTQLDTITSDRQFCADILVAAVRDICPLERIKNSDPVSPRCDGRLQLISAGPAVVAREQVRHEIE